MTALTDSHLATQDQNNPHQEKANEAENEPILCPHCLRTASNGIKCCGICVADSDY